MSMGTIDNYLQVVDEKTVKKVVGAKQFNEFSKLLAAFRKDVDDAEISDGLSDGADGFNGGSFGMTIDPDENEDWKKLYAAYKALKAAFAKKSGVRACYVYFPSDGGDCYDDITAGTWGWVLYDDDVWVPRKLTKKAENFIKKFGKIQLDQRFSRYC